MKMAAVGNAEENPGFQEGVLGIQCHRPSRKKLP